MLRIIQSSGRIKCNPNIGSVSKLRSLCTWFLECEWIGMEILTVTEYHFYISDDNQHDNLFMQHCFCLHREFLQTQGQPLPVEHII
jgi:hypothetical protein